MRPSCEIIEHDMQTDAAVQRVKVLGVQTVSAVAVNGTLALYCVERGIDKDALRT